MKFNTLHLELALVILLVVLMYQSSNFLNRLVEHPLAKVLLLIGVVVISHNFGRNAGVISGLIVILLFHNMFEGMENKDDDASDKESTEKDDDTASSDKPKIDDEEDKEEKTTHKEKTPEPSPTQENDETETETENFESNTRHFMDKTELEEHMRKPKDSNKDHTTANIEVATNEHEPLAVSKEAFTLYR